MNHKSEILYNFFKEIIRLLRQQNNYEINLNNYYYNKIPAYIYKFNI